MEQLVELWRSFDTRRKAVIIGATLVVFLGVLGLARMASAPKMALLYSNLEPAASGEVLGALDARSVPYQVRGGSIFVPEDQRDSLRMALAGEGLPSNLARGYELLDGLSGFGTTAQMFDAAYWRAKEGELARTITANPLIAAARVHIAQPPASAFSRNQNRSASVSVTTRGGAFPNSQARALKYLVASAVEGLAVEDVAIIDSTGALIDSDAETQAGQGLDARAEALRQSVHRLLEARVGRDNAVVEVRVEAVTQTESIRERLVDPDSRVAISSETEENSTSDSGGNEQVSVASNLPDGDAAANGNGVNQSEESRERVNYEVSETLREVTRAPGSIRRVTVAVLVNGAAANDGGEVRVRSDDELNSLRELVASAVGFDEARGDVITIKSMIFENSADLLPAGTAGSASPFDLGALAQMGVLAAVVLALGLFVVRPLLLNQPQPAALAPPESRDAIGGSIPVLDGEIDNARDGGVLAIGGANSTGSTEALGQMDHVGRLRAMIAERQDETVEILRGWLEDEKERV